MLFLDGKNTKKLLHTYFSATTTKNWLWLIFRIIIYVYHLIMISFYFYHLVISCDHVFPPQEMKFSILLHNFFFHLTSIHFFSFLCHNQWNSIFNYTTLLWHRTSLTKKLQSQPPVMIFNDFLLILIIIIII